MLLKEKKKGDLRFLFLLVFTILNLSSPAKHFHMNFYNHPYVAQECMSSTS